MARTISKNPGRDMTRLQRHAANTLGVLMTDSLQSAQVYRSQYLDILDQYYEGTQYEDKQDWFEAEKESENYVPIRDRKPCVQYNLPHVLVNKVAAKIIGTSAFPTFLVEEDDDDTAFFRTVVKASSFRRNLIEPVKRCLNGGSVFVRYYFVDGQIQMEYALSKYCYPVFDAQGELDQIEIKYVYDDWNDKDSKGNPKQKWYCMLLTKTSDIMMDNPEYRPGVKPSFSPASQVDHNLGWVQGEWLSTYKDKHNFDGHSLYADILSLIDDINYNLSQSSHAVKYNLEPQLTVNNVDEDELEKLVRSSQKAWNLGREGKAEFVESNGKGMESAEMHRGHVRNLALEVVRVILQDPEKINGNVASGEALKQMNAPLVELVDEMRQVLEPSLTALLIKIAMTALRFNADGMDTAIQTPKGYSPSSLDITVQWPPVFPPTIADIQAMAQAAQLLSQSSIISRETLTKWVAQVIPSVDNIEEELKRIETQEPLPSPFGTFE